MFAFTYVVLGLVVFILRITVSAIYLALFTPCMFALHCSVDFNKLNDDDDDDDDVCMFAMNGGDGEINAHVERKYRMTKQ